MGAAERGLTDIRFERNQRRPIEKMGDDAIGPQLLDFFVRGLFAARAAPDLDPSAGTQQFAGAGGRRELQVLLRGAEDQRRHNFRGRGLVGLGRGEKIAPQRACARGHRAIADMSARVLVERGARDCARRAREEVGNDRLALDYAGVAEARFVRRFALAIDNRDGPAARLQGKRGGNADHSRSEHDRVDTP